MTTLANMQSMTGYGRKTVNNEQFSITVEATAVNRKNLEVVSSAPKEWFHFDRMASEIAKKLFHRGRIQVQVKIEKTETLMGNADWDDKLVMDRLEAFKKLCKEAGVECITSEELLLNLLKLPGAESGFPEWEAVETLLQKAIKGAFEDLKAMRTQEGDALKNDLSERLKLLASCAQSIEKLAPEVGPNHRKALLERLAQAELEIDPEDERVLKEIALFVDRSDISEELTRLQSHFVQLHSTLENGGAIGRKIDFILQEVFREFNTIGSKANNFEISQLVIEGKNELERFREQAQNIE